MRRRACTSGLLAAAAVLALAGCASTARSGHPIELASAYVVDSDGPASLDAYVVIRNSGPADHLVKVTSSAGGTVLLRGPSRPGSPSGRTVSELAIPADSLVRLIPTGVHLVIVHSGPVRRGRFVTLTLTFAHAGTVRIPAQVTNLLGNPTANSGVGNPGG